jgi:cellulose synthase/poly-beta-1,6-N-acetylglucosamine synthase-like glycosyltransferase
MNKTAVSVVMVTRNVDRFLAESIESILGQTFRDFEFVIADFGSTDDSKSIISSCASRDNRLKLHTIPSCGLAEARNAGSLLAEGRYIAIMDADDISLPNRLLWEVEFMEKHPEVAVVGGAVEWINATGRPLMIAQHPLGDRELQSALLTHSVLWQPTVLIRRDAFASVGGYRGAFAPAEDYDLWLRIAEHFQIANLEQVVLKYRIHPYQVSLSRRTQQTLGILAAQASASSRRLGKPDPLDGVEQITPTLLVGLGVTEARQQRELAKDYRQWTEHMYRAGEDAVPLQAALEFLQSPLEHVERSQIAGLYLIVAKLWWRQKRFTKSFLAMGRAFITWPVVAVRLLEAVLRRLGLG